MPVAVTGSIAADHLMHFPGRFAEQILPEQLHQISLSFLVDDLEVRNGGVGANIAYAMGVLGASPLLIGAVGKDFDSYREFLESNGVDCSAVRISADKHTARFVSTADNDMCQISSFYAGAMAEADQIELAPIADSVGGFDLVLIASDAPDAMQRHAKECRDHGFTFAADPSQQLARMDGAAAKEFVRGAKYLFTNDYEWELLLRKTGWTEAEVLSEVGARVTTLGEHGVQIISATSEPIKVAAVPATTKGNPTGSGDAFRGGFLTALANGFSLERAAQLGALIGVLSFEAIGPQDWRFDRQSALRRLADAYGQQAADELGAILPA